MKWAVAILFFAALLADIYIYRNVICAYFRKLPARTAYIIFAILSNAAAVAVLFLYGSVAGKGTGFVMAMMWVLWVFFLTALPKLFFAAGGMLDHLVSVMVRRRILIFRPVAIVLSVASVAVMIHGAMAGRINIKISEIEFCSDRVPASFDGYRIVQFSDLHLGSMPSAEGRVSRIVEKINGLDPDIVINTGDVIHINHTDLTSELIALLSDIKAADGVWSVWGNHDLGFYIKDTEALSPRENLAGLSGKFGAMGWNTLCNESVYIRRGGDSILLSGLNYSPDKLLSGHDYSLGGADLRRTFAGIGGGSFNIVASHAPQEWNDIVNAGFGDLTMSGHVHSMQVKLNLLGTIWSPAKYFYREWSGLYEKNNGKKSSLYINDGIGCVGFPMRIGAVPELTLFILKRCE